jgi:SAM-dependent methyltransferase
MREDLAIRILDEVRTAYDTIAEGFSATRRTPWPATRRFRNFVKPGDEVLDIGCGNGRNFAIFDGIIVSYVGLDNSAELIRHACAQVRDMLAEFVVADALKLPVEDASQDMAMAVAVYHHLPTASRRAQAVREAYRCLRSGGTFVMTNWNLWRPSYWPLHLKTLVAWPRLDWGDLYVPWRAGGRLVQRYCHAFTKREATRLCRAAGFEIIENKYDAPWWRAGNLITICRKPSS